jgi:dethiobiotin synthetase
MTIPTVVIVGADKGGVGKTTISRALLDYFHAHGVDHRAFDTEAPDGVLKRFFPDKTQIVDLSKSDGQMTVFDTLTKSTVTVIDVRAGLLSPTLRTLSDIGFLDAVKENKVKIVVLHVLGSTLASFDEIKATAALLAGSKHYLVTNHINDTSYLGWDSDAAQATLGLGTAIIDTPKLNELATEHVENAGVPFTKFIANTDNSWVIRGYVKHWLARVFAQFGEAELNPQ